MRVDTGSADDHQGEFAFGVQGLVAAGQLSVQPADPGFDRFQDLIAANQVAHGGDVVCQKTVSFQMCNGAANDPVGGHSPLAGLEVGKQIQRLGGAQQLDGDDVFRVGHDFPAFAG